VKAISARWGGEAAADFPAILLLAEQSAAEPVVAGKEAALDSRER
jgi:hypothetical protein